MVRVESYYDQNADGEWQRLERHRTEFAVTMRALHEYLPPAPATILDIGGGPGRYAIALAREGYTVTIADLSAASLNLADRKAQQAGVRLRGLIHASALDLSVIDTSSYDVVLLMGPLYHLLTAEERGQAAAEARRVLKPRGRIFATFITRFAPFRDAANKEPLWIVQDPPYTEHLLATGQHTNAPGFTDAYFAHPGEVIPLMESAGFSTIVLVGCEGVVAGLEAGVGALTGRAWQAWVDLNYRLGKDPTLHGAADHLLYIGKSPSP